MTTIAHETEITVDPKIPAVHITREFNAPRDKVFRAHTDPELVAQWLGPRRHQMRIDHYDCRTGGSYPYVHHSDGNNYGFHGSFHEVRPEDGVIVQTLPTRASPTRSPWSGSGSWTWVTAARVSPPRRLRIPLKPAMR